MCLLYRLSRLDGLNQLEEHLGELLRCGHVGSVPGWEFDEPPGRIRPSPVYVSGKTLSLLALGAQHIDAGIGTPAG
jgi:hypothetical protein